MMLTIRLRALIAGFALLAPALIPTSAAAAPAWYEPTLRQREATLASAELPAGFVAWIKNDPVVRVAVLTSRDPAATAKWLRHLEIDLGEKVVRTEYTQLCLAMATVAAVKEVDDKNRKATREGGPWTWAPDLTSRKPYVLKVAMEPAKPTEPLTDDEKLIIDFLKKAGKVKGPTPNGKVANPSSLADHFSVRGTLPVIPHDAEPYDIFSNPELRAKFNAYMKDKGSSFQVANFNLTPNSSRFVASERSDILEAYTTFRSALEHAGTLATRDPYASPTERIAFIINTDREKLVKAGIPASNGDWGREYFTEELDIKKAPWPLLTLLVADPMPLRERADLLQRLKKREYYVYGEYIGGIAQDFDMQSARRLSAYPFGYGSMQMALKDGGVCGTMAFIHQQSYTACNIPAATASQPAHCALMRIAAKKGKLSMDFMQNDHVHADEQSVGLTPYYLGNDNQKRPYLVYKALADTLQPKHEGFLESCVAAVCPEFPAKVEAIKLAPYNHALIVAAVDTAKNPAELAAAHAAFVDGCKKSKELEAYAIVVQATTFLDQVKKDSSLATPATQTALEKAAAEIQAKIDKREKEKQANLKATMEEAKKKKKA